MFTVVDTNGTHVISKNNYINMFPPTANFTKSRTIVILPQSLNVNDTSTNVPTSWNWKWGEGVNSTTQNATHTYTTAGNYTINLEACNAAGCSDTSQPIRVVPMLTAFSANTRTPYLGGPAVQFTDSTLPAATSWQWDFGDGGTATTQNPNHVYLSAGSYDVKLRAESSGGYDWENKTAYISVGGNSWSVYRNDPLAVFLNIWNLVIGIVSVIAVGLLLYFLKWMYDPKAMKGVSVGIALLKSMAQGLIVLIILYIVIMYIGGTMAGL
jgi:PKD repeat protein